MQSTNRLLSPRLRSVSGKYIGRSIILLLISFIFVSCVVQKRRYMPGYHFGFTSKLQHPVPHKTEPSLLAITSAAIDTVKSVTLGDDLQKTTAQGERKPVVKQTGDKAPPHWFHKAHALIKDNPPSEWSEKHGLRAAYKSASPEEPEHKLLVTALIGLILSVFSILLIIGGAYLIIVNPELLTVLFGIFILIIGAIGLLVAFFLDIVSLIQKADEPGNYGEWMAFVSMFLCLAAVYIIVHAVMKN